MLSQHYNAQARCKAGQDILADWQNLLKVMSNVICAIQHVTARVDPLKLAYTGFFDYLHGFAVAVICCIMQHTLNVVANQTVQSRGPARWTWTAWCIGITKRWLCPRAVQCEAVVG